MAATMSDVAKAAGVSIKTVSNFFNGYPYMRAETRARIEAAVAELGYRMNVSARNLRSGRSRMIALVIPELDSAYLAPLAQDVIDAADELGLSVLVETTAGRRDREIGALSGLHRQVLDGVIYEPLALHQEDADLIDLNVPLVMIGQRFLEGLADQVLIADRDAAHAAVAHLVETGRRRIALLGVRDADEPSGSALRQRGAEDALAAAGIPLDPRLQVDPGPWRREAGAAAMARLLDDGVELDAVFGFNDSLALGAQWALQERGLRVPEDVAVAGLDDTEDSRFAQPPLTTVSPGRRAIARRAVAMLAERIERGTDAGPFRSETMGFELLVRGSTVARGVAR
ncbi:HTH-type transcriptional regulator DegA [Clavibacter michiganensis]|uniref:HTH-type transcriptional regulator DegA n=1 Tax=Clavibacter michiganensis TaxID=28447 RepID=A0A251YLE4_9MICO|nr:LacI family DNA-binding transcriptional regulator [Clavibacter michiganensis]OUE25047.1 HTH-type transcriptional regulator DegA [Clavibacter michiganensis]